MIILSEKNVNVFSFLKFRDLEQMKTLSLRFWHQELTKKSEKLTESTEKVRAESESLDGKETR